MSKCSVGPVSFGTEQASCRQSGIAQWVKVAQSLSTNQGLSKVRSYKLFSIGRFSYIVPIMAGHDGRKNLVLHASNYIVHLYPTAQEDAPVLIVVTAYSDSVTTRRECLPQPSVFRHPTTTRRPALRPVLASSRCRP